MKNDLSTLGHIITLGLDIQDAIDKFDEYNAHTQNAINEISLFSEGINVKRHVSTSSKSGHEKMMIAQFKSGLAPIDDKLARSFLSLERLIGKKQGIKHHHGSEIIITKIDGKKSIILDFLAKESTRVSHQISMTSDGENHILDFQKKLMLLTKHRFKNGANRYYLHFINGLDSEIEADSMEEALIFYIMVRNQYQQGLEDIEKISGSDTGKFVYISGRDLQRMIEIAKHQVESCLTVYHD